MLVISVLSKIPKSKHNAILHKIPVPILRVYQNAFKHIKITKEVFNSACLKLKSMSSAIFCRKLLALLRSLIVIHFSAIRADPEFRETLETLRVVVLERAKTFDAFLRLKGRLSIAIKQAEARAKTAKNDSETEHAEE